MPLNFYPYTALIGGGAGALDGQDGAALADGDAAMVITDAGVYWYHLNATSAAAENSPFRISPDVNAGNKRWHLVGTTAVIGALVKITSDQTISNSTITSITFNAATYDVGGFWAGGAPTRLTIPIGVSKVKVKAGVYWEANDVGYRHLRIYKNNALFDGIPMTGILAKNTSELNCSSPVLSVAATDYFEARVKQISEADLDILFITAGITWFAIQAVEFA